MANINETISEVQKLNPELARQITRFVKDHSYGLVFEENLPEAVRLYTKTPSVNDTVNIRPARGCEETEDNKVSWVIKSISNNKATIERDGETKDISVEDLVTVVDYRAIIYPGLREIDRIEKGNPGDPYHMVINSENYHALETLVYAYAGKVNCIYIDPPYNKENSRDWKYNCNYIDSTDKYRHSKWLAFIKRRLQLADKLLNKEDSVLIVTIDEVEYLRLGLLLEQMFPDARIQMISSQINYTATARRNQFDRINEFIYVLMFGNCQIFTQDESKNFKKDDEVNWRSLRRQNSSNIRDEQHPNQFYPIYIDVTTNKIVKVGDSIPMSVSVEDVEPIEGCETVFPIRDNGMEMMWGLKRDTFLDRLSKGYVRVGKHTPDKPQKYILSFLEKGMIEGIESGDVKIIGKRDDGSVIAIYNTQRTIMPKTQWSFKSHDAREYGTYLLDDTIGEKRFPYAKSLYAVHDCLRYFVANKPDALIVDFFAGSGTTLHAVNLLNAEDNGHRRCICITNNEVKASEAEDFTNKGLRQGDTDWEKYGIANYVTWIRTKCSIEGVDVNGNALQGNYGCDIEDYEELEADVFDPETGKKIRGKVYKKTTKPAYPELAAFNMSDGFKANAIFCELTYEDAWNIRLDKAFNAIAPILWMLAGCQGEIIRNIGKTYLTTDYYGVLFDYSQASKFCEKVKSTPSIKTVFVVTDDQRRYSNMCKRLPNVEVHRLYESFLKTFEICGEGGLD